jgi:hypothetical protein
MRSDEHSSSSLTRSRSLLIALWAIGAAGCMGGRQVRVDFSEAPREYLAKDYSQVYERWTRHDYALTGVDKSLEVWTTFKSWDYREAYVERYASIYNLSAADRTSLRQAQLDGYQGAYEFTVTALAHEYRWNDLEKANSAWRVTLLDALGHELAPKEIKVERFPDAYEREFFPARNQFNRVFTKSYAIRFAVPANGEFAGVKSGALTLRFLSPIGRIDLVWQG